MKFTKQIILPALVCCGLLVSVISCTDEKIEATNVALKSKSVSASRLSALADKVKPSNADLNEYVKVLKTLSFDEAMEYRSLQHEKLLLKRGSNPNLTEALEKDMLWFKSINLKSIELFDKPMNQITNTQMDEVFIAMETKNSKQAKVAKGCPAAVTNASYTFQYDNVTPIAQMTTVSEVAQIKDPKDCDCELVFRTKVDDTTRNYSLNGTTIDSRLLLLLYGTNVSGKITKNGTKEGYYPVLGANRVRYIFPGGCYDLLGLFILVRVETGNGGGGGPA
jgi:hypothetical protein